jgi:hypothetical protein
MGMALRDELTRQISGSPKDAFDRFQLCVQKWQLQRLSNVKNVVGWRGLSS